MNGEAIIKMPDTQIDELQPFVDAASSCPKTGLHNPLKNKERYLLYGDICHKAGVEMSKPEVHDFYAKCIARVSFVYKVVCGTFFFFEILGYLI